MKKSSLLLLLLFVFANSFSQQLYLSIKGGNEVESKRIDSIGYSSTFDSAKKIQEEVQLFALKALSVGFLENQILGNKKTNDSTFEFTLQLGPKTSKIYLNTSNLKNTLLFDEFTADKNILEIDITNVENYLSILVKKAENAGFSLTKVNLANFRRKNDSLIADLQIIENNKRFINDIVLKGYEKFPASHLKNIKRIYRNRIFNQKTVERVNTDFEKIQFVKQIKFPEILFLTDSTKIYVYLEKAKANKFDGFIGFSNDNNNKLTFRGYLDLELQNFLNSGEKLNIYWKSDGNQQTSFNAGLELPYLFGSPLGIKTQLTIFKQDSTFQNTKSGVDLGYYFHYNKKVFVGYEATASNDIQNQNSTSLNDYKNSFLTSAFYYQNANADDFLFPIKTLFNLKVGFGKRNANLNSNEQMFIQTEAFHNLYLNSKNVLHLKSQNYYLQSDTYIINELYRFGGINSIRGFNENSLQANFLSSILSEYRYLLNSSIYVHSILDYAYFKDDSTNSTERLFGAGFGLGLLTTNGLFNLVYANGNASQNTFKLSNSIVHISFKANF